MKVSKNKPKWGKPKLIVLTRGKPEEMVLAACKGFDPVGPGDSWGVCVFEEMYLCVDCSSFAQS
ncbi:MAG: hypothetical protein KKH08_03230 [Candidatus Omnitrophica bacterium]|nr:hypothetical protein [Candidatus Omnitrophota bacterium]